MTKKEATALKDRVAETIAKYAPDAFSDRNAKCERATAEFPVAFSAKEVRCFRKLAGHILDAIREPAP